MANTLTVGTLRALLTADTAQFDAAMARSADRVTAWSRDFTKLGLTNQQTGQLFTESMTRSLTAVNKLAQSFSGAGIARSADEYAAAIGRIGGASRLTESEQAKVNAVMTEAIAKYRALGLEAPAHLQKIADATKKASTETSFFDESFARLTAAFGAAALIERAGEALIDFGKKAIMNANQLVELHAKTGVSIEGLQRMSFVAQQTGTDVNAFTDAIFKLGTNVGKGGEETRKAVAQMGISWQAFKALAPEEQFNLIVANLDKLGPAGQRNEALVALFGKSVGNIVAGLTENYKKLADQAIVSSDAQVIAVNNASKAWERFETNVTSTITGTLGSIVILGEKMQKAGFIKTVEDFGRLSRTTTTEGQAMTLALMATIATAEADAKVKSDAAAASKKTETAATVDYAASLKTAQAEMAKFTAAQEADIAAGIKLGKSNTLIAESANASVDAVELYKKKLEEQTAAGKKAASEAEAAAKKLAAANAEIASALRPLNALAVEYVNTLAREGVSEEKIAESLGVTVTQVKAVTTAEKTRLEFTKVANTQAIALWNQQLVAAQKLAQGVLQLLGVYETTQRRRDDLGKRGLSLELANINRGETAELEALEKITVAHDALYFKTVANIQTYYQHLRDVALGTADTIVERMNALGIKTQDVLAQNAADALRDYNQMLASGRYTTEQLQVAWQRYHDAVTAANASVAGAFRKSLADLSASFAQLGQIAGGSLGGIAKAVGTEIGLMDTLAKAMDGLKAAETGKAGKGGVTSMDRGAFASSMITAVTAVYAIGKAIADYVIAAEHAALVTRTNRQLFAEWGVTLQDDVEPAIEKTVKDLFGFTGTLTGMSDGMRQIGEAMNLSRIIDEMGGAASLTASQMVTVQARVETLFHAIASGGQIGSAASQELVKVITQLGDAATAAGGLWSKSFNSMIARAQALGIGLEEIQKLQQQQRDNATTGINAALDVTRAAYDAQAADEQKLADLKSQLSGSQITDLAKIQDLKAKMAGADAVHAAAYQQQINALLGGQDSLLSQIDAVNKDLQTQADIIGATQIVSQDQATGLAESLTGLVAAGQAAGLSFSEAVKAQAPAIASLQAQLAATGFDGGEAFAEIRAELDLVNDAVAGPALTALDGMRAGLIGLANAGDLTQSKFVGLTTSIGTTYTKLIALGKDPKVVMAGMQTDLQAAWEAEQEFGYKADDVTQSLIDQAVEAGTVGEKHKSIAQQQLDAQNKMVDALNRVADLMENRVPGAAKKMADHITDAVDSIPRDIDFRVHYDNPGFVPPGGASGGEPPTVSAATEGYFAQPTRAVVGDVAGGEVVLHAGRFRAIAGLMDSLAGISAVFSRAASYSGSFAAVPASALAASLGPAPSLAATAAPLTSASGTPAPVGASTTVINQYDTRISTMDGDSVERLIRKYGMPAIVDEIRRSASLRRDLNTGLEIP